MNKVVLTEEEEKRVKYCEDFCPIYDSIRDYNQRNNPPISCTSDMCTGIISSYILGKRASNN